MTAAGVTQVRHIGFAARHDKGTARVEGATWRWVDRRRYVAFEHDALALGARVGNGRRRHERTRIRMAGAIEQRLFFRDLEIATAEEQCKDYQWDRQTKKPECQRITYFAAAIHRFVCSCNFHFVFLTCFKS